jgi:protein-disulfide isomerase
MRSAQVQSEIDNNLATGKLLGISGTPTLIFGDELVPGAIIYRKMTMLVEKARRECKVC